MRAAYRQGLRPYVPRLVVDWVRHHRGDRFRVVEGSLLSADISGFTALSERLATLGRAGAEELTDLLNRCFDGMIAAAQAHGGDVLKFGGDALLILFRGPEHTARACAAASEMRACLAHPLTSERAPRVRLRMSQGIHAGEFNFFLVGDEYRELIVTGPAVTATVACESAAGADEILLSHAAAKRVDPSWLGTIRPQGTLLRRRALKVESWIDLEPDPPLHEELKHFVAPVQQKLITAGIGGELRQATIAFAKFSDTDAIVERDGPEELAHRLDALAAAIGDATREHGVHWLASDVNTDGGKAILTAGAPSSSGHDEEDMLHTVRAILDAGVPLTLRVGLNRGPVFAGDLGSPTRRTFTVMGDAVNLAARLMQKAEPGQMIASQAVLERSSTRFAAQELAPFTVKGKTQPIHAAAVGPVVDATRQSPDVAAPFVGRDPELGVLEAALIAAHDDRGYAIELVGDAGIGKSRLLAEFRRRTETVPALTIACGQYLRATPYLAVRPLLRSLVGIDPRADPVAAGDQLTRWVLEHAPALQPWLPLLAIPFDASVAPTPESDRVAPRFRRSRMQRAVLDLVVQTIPRNGLLVVEDANWLDDASRSLLIALIGEGGTRPWMFVLTRRPGPAVLPTSSRAMEVVLEPLPSADAAELAAALTEDQPQLSPADVAALSERAGGNPLFVLELVSTAAAQGSVEALPESIEALMTSRIDTLAPRDRMLLRDASVLGSLVDTELLAAALDDSSISRETRWAALRPFFDVDGDKLRFRHALFRHAAYEGLSYRRRKRVHAAVGAVLEERTPDPMPIAGLLSTHFDQAQDHVRACRYSLLAGEDARAKYANVEAAQFLQRVIDNAPGADLSEEELNRVAETLGDVNELAGRYDEADRAYAIARRCAGNPVGTARLMHKQGQLRERAGQYSSALRWFARALRVAEAGSEEQDANRAELALAYGGVRYRQGRYAECVQWTREAVHAAERAGDRKSVAHALDLWDLALLYWKEGTREHEQGAALAIYQEIGDLIGQSSALNNLGIAAYQDGRWDEARTLYERSRAASEQAGDVNGTATALFNLGEILHDQGHVDEARRALSDARRIWRSARYPIGVAVATLHLGRTEMRAGNLPEALALLDDAVAQFRAISGTSFVHDARIRRVECLLLLGRSDDALMEADAVHAEIGEGATDPLLRVALHRARARARLGTGDAVSALAIAEEAMARALAAGAPYELAETLLTRADVLDALGRADAAEDRARGAHLFAELSVVDRADVR